MGSREEGLEKEKEGSNAPNRRVVLARKALINRHGLELRDIEWLGTSTNEKLEFLAPKKRETVPGEDIGEPVREGRELGRHGAVENEVDVLLHVI